MYFVKLYFIEYENSTWEQREETLVVIDCTGLTHLTDVFFFLDSDVTGIIPQILCNFTRLLASRLVCKMCSRTKCNNKKPKQDRAVKSDTITLWRNHIWKVCFVFLMKKNWVVERRPGSMFISGHLSPVMWISRWQFVSSPLSSPLLCLPHVLLTQTSQAGHVL